MKLTGSLIAAITILTPSAWAGNSARLPAVFEPSVEAGDVAIRLQGSSIQIGPVFASYRSSSTVASYSMRFKGANKKARLTLVGKLAGTSSYFKGAKSSWRTSVPQYSGAMARDIYPGVDVSWHEATGRVEYDLIVRPSGDPTRIRIGFDHASIVRVLSNGSLLVKTDSGEASEPVPFLYQQYDDRRVAVHGGFRLRRGNQVSFNVGPYDHNRPLIIDPVIDFITLLGGSEADSATGIALDPAQNIYLAGTTTSTDFPHAVQVGTIKTGHPTSQYADVFVTKLDPTGKTILYSVLVGGTDEDTATGIVVDGNGNAYVSGTTQSLDFPTSVCLGSTVASSQGAFVFKLNSSGSALVYSTCLSPSVNTNALDSANGIAVDAGGNAYVGGVVHSGFPVTPGAAQTQDTNSEVGFVGKLNPSGSAFVWATYLGGSQGATGVNAIALDAAGNTYVTGIASGSDFPTTPGAYQTQYKNANQASGIAFVTKVSADGSKFLYSTYLGGSGVDSGASIAVGKDGSAYVTGSCNAGSSGGQLVPFPVSPGAAFSVNSTFQGFLAKVNPNGSALAFSTYLAQDEQYGFGVALATDGSVYVIAGGSEQASYYEDDEQAFVLGTTALRFSADGTQLVASQFIGGFAPAAIALTSSGAAMLTGTAGEYLAIGTPGALQENLNGFRNAFVAEADLGSSIVPPTLIVDAQNLTFQQIFPATSEVPITVNLTSTGAPIAFHLGGAQGVALSATEGLTPAAITVTPLQTFGSGTTEYITLVASGVSNGYQIIPIGGYAPPVNLNVTTDGYQTTGISFTILNSSITQSQVIHVAASVNPEIQFRPPINVNVQFQMASDTPWLTFQPSSGTTPADITVTANAAGLGNGFAISSISVISTGPPAEAQLNAYFLIGPFLNLQSSGEIVAAAGVTSVSENVPVTSTGSPLNFTITPPSATWLTVSPLTGTTPATLTITANTTGLAPGEYRTGLSISSPKTYTFEEDLLFNVPPAAPVPVAASSAAPQPDPDPGISPGSIASLYGANLSSVTAGATSVPLPNQISGTSVEIGGIPAPLFYVSPYQVNIQVPSQVPLGPAAIQLTSPLGTFSGTVMIVPASPGVFVGYTNGSPTPTVLNLDGTFNNPGHPANPGDYVVLYMTGQGALDNPIADGEAASSQPLSRAVLPVTVTIGGLNAVVVFAGMTPGVVGLFQVNVQIPEIYAGDQVMTIQIGHAQSAIFPVAVGSP